MSKHEDRTKARRNQERKIDPAALAPLVAVGFTPIPLDRWNAKQTIASKGRTVIKELGKRPRDSDWMARHYDPKTVIGDCLKHGWNIGIRVPASWVVIDVDPRNGGNEGLANLCEDFGLDPSMWPCVRTGSGGLHYFLRKPEGVKVVDTLRHEDDPKEGPGRYCGVEFKSYGRQMVAPGSWHPCGVRYEWETFGDLPDLSDAPDVPAGLLEAITRPVRVASAGGGHITPDRLAKSLDGLDPEDFREHDKWLQAMMAAHHATGGDGREEFIEWSTSDPEYVDNAEEIGRRWDSLHAERNDGVTVASLNRFLVDAERKDLLLPTSDAERDFDADPIQFKGDDETEDTEFDAVSKLALSIMSAAEINPEPIKWLWPDRIPEGKITMIAGFPEAGKSQATVDIAATVSTGGEWPNNEGKAKQGAVFILSSEDDAGDTIIPRLKAAGADMSQVFIVNSIVKTDGKTRLFNLADDLSNLSDAIKAQRENGHIVRLVVIDPISAYVGSGNKGDSHKNTEMRALLTPLKEWAAKHRVAVVAISHFNKGGNSHAVYRVTDSLAFTAAARMVWFCIILESGQRVMIRGKGNISEDVGGLAYSIEGVKIKDNKGRKIKTSRVVWGDPVSVTADEAMNKRTQREASTVDEAADWLESFLEDGPKNASAVKAAAEQAGFSKYALDNAKTALGIEPKRTDFRGGWQWGLPAEAELEETEFD